MLYTQETSDEYVLKIILVQSNNPIIWNVGKIILINLEKSTCKICFSSYGKWYSLEILRVVKLRINFAPSLYISPQVSENIWTNLAMPQASYKMCGEVHPLLVY